MERTEEYTRLVENNLDLVSAALKFCIHSTKEYGMEYDDLYQIGSMALCKAADRYEKNQGAAFRTFASVVIRNSLLDHIRQIKKEQQPIPFSAPLPYRPTLTYGDIIDFPYEIPADEDTDEVLHLLSNIKKEYSGVTRKGIDALSLQIIGYTSRDIAELYGVKSNHVSAWVSRATKKLRSNKQILALYAS